MRRRQLMEAGASMLAATVTARQHRPPASRVQTEVAIEQLVTATYDEPGLATGLSASGDVVVYGFDDGNVMIHDEERDGDVLPLAVDQAVSHVLVRESRTAIVAWMDADLFGPLDLEDGDGALVEHRGLWDVDATADGERIASVSQPVDTVGSVGVADNQGTVMWSSTLEEATGYAVAMAENGEYVAVGAAHYGENGSEPTGRPGIRLYDDTGDELWRYDHDNDVLSVGISTAHEVVTAGTDDGRTTVLDLEGNLIWESHEYGGWIALSGDGETILTSEPDGTLVALESTTGEERWRADVDRWAGEDLSVSDDGSRCLLADRGEGEFTLVDEGETIWTESHDVGPGRGTLASDGSAWSTIVTDLEAESSLLEAYRDPEAISEYEPTTGDEPASEEEDESPGGEVSVSLELVDYYILGSDPDEEYITLQNTGEETLEMEGWILRDREDGGRVNVNLSPFVFPRGFTLEPSAEVTIVSGQGGDTDEILYWGQDQQQVWNEDSDIVIVQNAVEEEVFREEIAANHENNEDGNDTPVSLELIEYYIDGDDPQEEEITIRNTGNAALDLTGWRIEDAHGIPAGNISPFEFPAGFTLDAGADVTLVTGQGTNTADTLYWGYRRHVWNEDGDVVFVFDAEGTLQLKEQIASDGASNGEPSGGALTVVIDHTNAPIEGGEHLQVVANVENTETADRSDTVELVVGGEVVDSQSVTVAGEATQRIDLGYTTYPVDQDVSFEVTVRTSDDSASRTVDVVAATDVTGENGDDSEAAAGESGQDDSSEPATESDDQDESGSADPADPEDEPGGPDEPDEPPEEPDPDPEGGDETPAEESSDAGDNDTSGGNDE
ncbi:lamin tail domain-containing protein [Saliphagus sp. GCM10025334]